MHPLYQKAAGLTETIIAAAIEVHRDKGPGLIESIFHRDAILEGQTHQRGDGVHQAADGSAFLRDGLTPRRSSATVRI